MNTLKLVFPECYSIETEDGTVIYRDLPSYDDANYLAAEFTIDSEQITILRNRFGRIKGVYEPRLPLDGYDEWCKKVR